MRRRGATFPAVGVSVLGVAALCAGALGILRWPHDKQPLTRQSAALVSRPAVTAAFGRLPLSFEENQGQFDPRVLYAARAPGGTLFFTREGLTLALPQLGPAPAPSPDPGSRFSHRRKVERVVALTMAFDGANPTPVVEASEQQAGIKNYLIGRDPAQWHTHVPLFGKVAYRGLYPGVDLVFRGVDGQLEYDLEVAPDADVRPIRFRFEGADRVEQVAGDVVVHAGPFELREPLLHVYDTSSEDRRELAAAYRVDDGRWIGFDVSGRAARHGLLIDPYVLAYSTYLTGNGGSTGNGGGSGDDAAGITSDAAGNVYVGGGVDSTNFPTTDGGYEPADPDPTDAYAVVTITKLDPTLSALVFSTYLGGMHEANEGYGGVAYGLAVTDAGLVYAAGAADSLDFPVTANAPQATYGGGHNDCFAAELSADGSELLFATLLGGPAEDWCGALDLDPSGNMDLVGVSVLQTGQSSADLPVTTAALQGTYGGGQANCFFARVNPSRDSFDFVSYFGGSGTGVYFDACPAIKADPDAAFWILGYTGSEDLPGAAMSLRPFHADGGGGDTFVARIASDGGGVLDFAYLGGSGVDFPWEMALDPTGNLYVVGQTSSTDFPVSAGAVQTSNASGENLNQDGPFDAFVTELSPEGAILYSTYLGGEGDDRAFGVALDSAGHVHLAGMTTSVGVERYVKDPLRGEHDQTLGFDVLPDGGGAFFLADLSLDGGLDFFSFFGAYGPGLPLPYGNTLAIDAADNLYFTGYVFQDGFPVTSGAFQAHDQVPVGLGTIVVSKIIPTPLPATLTAVQPTTGRAGTNVDVYGTNLGPQCQLTFGEVVEPVSGASTTELVTQLVPTSDCGPVDVSVACVGSPIFVLPGGFTYIGCDGGGGGGTDGGESRTDGGTDGGTGSGSSGCSSSAASAPDGILFALVVLAAAGRPGRQRKHP